MPIRQHQLAQQKRYAATPEFAAKSVNAAARNTDVAAEQLHDRHCAGVLSTVGVLSLTQSAKNHACLARSSKGCVSLVNQLQGFLVQISISMLGQARLNEVLDDVVVHTAVERNIRAGTNGAIDIRELCSTGITGVNNNPLSAALMGLVQLLRGNGVVLNGARTAVENNVGILESESSESCGSR